MEVEKKDCPLCKGLEYSGIWYKIVKGVNQGKDGNAIYCPKCGRRLLAERELTEEDLRNEIAILREHLDEAIQRAEENGQLCKEWMNDCLDKEIQLRNMEIGLRIFYESVFPQYEKLCGKNFCAPMPVEDIISGKWWKEKLVKKDEVEWKKSRPE
jgi:hypothetical protein